MIIKGIDEAIDEKTKAIYCESIGNPLVILLISKDLQILLTNMGYH